TMRLRRTLHERSRGVNSTGIASTSCGPATVATREFDKPMRRQRARKPLQIPFALSGGIAKVPRARVRVGGRSMQWFYTCVAAVAASALALTSAQAQDKLKVGIIASLSGPPAVLGTQLRNGFQLAVKTMGNKLGGRDVEMIVQDDELKPDVALSKVKAF